jgi:hypothetical protein
VTQWQIDPSERRVSRVAIVLAGILLGVTVYPAPRLLGAPAGESAPRSAMPQAPPLRHRAATDIDTERAPVATSGRVVASSVLSAGVGFVRIRRDNPPQEINVIVVTPHARLKAVLMQAGPDWAPFASVSFAVRRVHALAGINGTPQALFAQSPMLVREGRVVASSRAGVPQERHPRTGVGIARDGSALFVTVDGRRASALGMTLREFAVLMRTLGAVWAVNLDGGASTTMVVRRKIMNSPSDPHGERRVPNAVVLLPVGRPGILSLVAQLREWDSRIPPVGWDPRPLLGQVDRFRGQT